MQLFVFGVLMSLIVLTSSQQVPTKSLYYSRGNDLHGRDGIVTHIQVPNYLQTGIEIVKKVPYVETLKLIEAFLRLKGEIASRAWALLYDNAHILSALRDTLISKLSTLHGLTLNALIVLRKVLEFASKLFSHVDVSVGSSGAFFDKSFSFGR